MVECLAWLGYFGEGPAYLPEKVTETYYDDGIYGSNESETEYVSSSSGTVAAEYWDDNYMIYSYITEDELPE